MRDLNYLIGETDAQIWAHEFCKTVAWKPEIATDEGTMIGWFANAIGSGEMAGEARERRRGLVEKIHEIIFQAAGAATQPLLEDHPDYVFPSDRVIAAVEEVLKEFGIPARRPEPAPAPQLSIEVPTEEMEQPTEEFEPQ